MSRIDEMRASLGIFREINDCFNSGIVVPYEEELVNFLATHTDKVDLKNTNYLDSLNSTASVSNCYIYARYVALGLKKPFKLYEGNLSALYRGRFDHCWIETEDSVYDVSFAGKWPKKEYYKLLKPKDKVEIDLNRDEKYIKYKNNLITAKRKSKEPILKYIGWYGYISNMLGGWPSGGIWFNRFPQDKKKEEEEYDEEVEEEIKEEIVEEPPKELDEPKELGYVIGAEKPDYPFEPTEYEVDSKWNLMITEYGAFMSNVSLERDYTDGDVMAYKDRFLKEYIKKGYKIVVGPSCLYPNMFATYLSNWDDPELQKKTNLVGCIRYSPLMVNNGNDIFEIKLRK